MSLAVHMIINNIQKISVFPHINNENWEFEFKNYNICNSIKKPTS